MLNIWCLCRRFNVCQFLRLRWWCITVNDPLPPPTIEFRLNCFSALMRKNRTNNINIRLYCHWCTSTLRTCNKHVHLICCYWCRLYSSCNHYLLLQLRSLLQLFLPLQGSESVSTSLRVHWCWYCWETLWGGERTQGVQCALLLSNSWLHSSAVD